MVNIMDIERFINLKFNWLYEKYVQYIFIEVKELYKVEIYNFEKKYLWKIHTLLEDINEDKNLLYSKISEILSLLFELKISIRKNFNKIPYKKRESFNRQIDDFVEYLYIECNLYNYI